MSKISDEKILRALEQAERCGFAVLALDTSTDEFVDISEISEVRKKHKKSVEPVQHTFSQALAALKDGLMIYRKIWGNKGDNFIFQQVPSEVDISHVPNMDSLPDSVKEVIMTRAVINTGEDFGSIRYSNQLAMVHPDNKIYSWNPSVSDLNAKDWIVVS
tara:strand:- start:2418 stop:2897 length:480 start_codon:yes stop_codon:yes gene_type:complete